MPRFSFWPTQLLAIACIFALSAVIFGPHITNPLLRYDDFHLTESLLPLANIDFFGFLKTYAGPHFVPVSNLTLLLDYQFCGSAGTCYHLSSAFFHSINAVLLFFIFVKAPGFSPLLSTLLSLLFLTNVAATEPVYWMAARLHLVQLMFCLLAVLTLLRFKGSADRCSYIGLLIFFVFAILSKSTSIALVPLIFLLWPYRKVSLKQSVLGLAPFAVGFIFVIWTFYLYGKLAGEYQNDFLKMDLLERLGLAAKALIFYLQQNLISWSSYIFYDVQRFQLNFAQISLSLLALALILASFRRDKNIALLCVLWIGAHLLPILKIIPFGENSLVNDRYIYLTLPAFLILLGLVLRDSLERRPRTRNGVLGILIAMIAMQSYFARAQGKVWSGNLALWDHVLARDSKTAIALTSIGRLKLGEAKHLEAAKLFESALDSRPDYVPALLNLALVKKALGDPRQGLVLVDRAIEAFPDHPDNFEVMGHILLDQKDISGAIRAFETCVEKSNIRASCSFKAGELLAESGDCRKAIPHLKIAIRHGLHVDRAQTLLTGCR